MDLQPSIEWMPFVAGRRPVDEASFPGLGSSDDVALILDAISPEQNIAYLLYRIRDLDGGVERYEIRVTLRPMGPWGDLPSEPLRDWNDRVVAPVTLDTEKQLVPLSISAAADRSLVIALSPVDDLAGEGLLSLEHLFMQQIRAEISLLRDGTRLSSATTHIIVADARQIGSLYRRVMERVIARDAFTQGRACGVDDLDRSFHPWFPVLLIGGEKAELYMRALAGDIVHKQRHLTDPGWLLRVGIYLELITCAGIIDAVRTDVGDAFTPEERRAYEGSRSLSAIREAADADGWKRVWSLRQIALPPGGSSHNAKTAALNLLTKRRATLAFLEAHHRDLRHAIRLAGPNEHNAQEAWHRVFRDAERAVLRKTATAFRELDVFPAKARQFVLWHRRGKFRGVTLPAASSWFGDQDGLYAVACHQYRASMNAVAEWAKQEGLMDHAGAECIPESVSLLRAMMDGRDDHLRRFQRRDGYAECAPVKNEPVFALLRGISIFDVLTNAEVALLALNARPIELGPVERIIVQGRKGTSLFVVADGTLEVMVRQKDGFDLPLCILERGAVFGEMSLLTGERRSATVRSVDAALIWEVGRQQLAPILRARPAAVTELAAVMERRFRDAAIASRRYETKKRGSLARRMREFLLAPAAVPQ